MNNYYKLSILILIILLIISFIPHSKEYMGWKNTSIACNERGGCACSAIAGAAVQEYKQNHNLTDDEFQTYIISNDETPPIW